MASTGAGWTPGVAPPWQPNTRYVAGQLVISPAVANPPNALIYATTTFVSAATWAADVGNWVGLGALANAYVPLSEVAAANGVASLDATGAVPAAELAHALLAGTTNADIGPSVGFDLRRNGAGQGNGNKATYFNLKIGADTIAQVNGVNGATGSKVDGLNLIHHMGGAATQGGRNTIEANLLFDGGATNAANADRNYVALQGQFIASTDDGGAAGAYLGAGFGGGAWAQLTGTAQYFANLTAFEFNTLTDPQVGGAQRVNYLAGIQIASANQQRGATYDCGIALSGLNGLHAGFRTALLIGDMNGGPALAADSTLMQVLSAPIPTLANGFDFTGVAFTGFLLKSLSVQINAPAGSASFEFGRRDGVASTPFFDWHSGAVAVDYDYRFQASGGDGVAGHGFMNFTGQSCAVNGTVAGSAPFAVNAVAGQIGAIAIFEVSGITLAQVNPAGGLQPGNSAAVSAGAIYGGNGAPAAGLGANGDYYLRNDTPGTANQRLYAKNAGAWTGIL